MAIRQPWGRRFGGGGEGSTATLVEPLSATRYYELDDLGSGTQLSYLRVGHIIFEFAARSPFLIKTYLSGALSTELTASYFTTETVDDQGDRFTITWTKAGETTTVVISGVWSETTGQLIMEIDSVVLDSSALGARSVWSASLEYRVKPVGQKSQMCAMLPAFGGIVYSDATTARSAEQVGDYPGYMQDTEPLTANGGQCGCQLVATWDRTARQCLAFRRIDADGRGARFRYDGDGSNVVLKFEFFPTNNLATQAVTGTAADGVTLAPMTGSWYEAATWYRGQLQAEGSAHLARGKIKDMTGAVGHISTDTLNCDLMIIMSPGNAFPPSLSTNDSAIWARTVEEVDRIVRYFGTDLKYVVHWGTWFNNGSNNWQDMYPALSRFVSAVGDVAALGYSITQIAYMFPTIVDPDSAWYTAQSASAFRVLDSSQAALIADVSSLQSDHNAIQFGSSSARSALTNQVGRVTSEHASIVGCYHDTITGFGPYSDYRASLTAAQKGPGASYYEAGKKTWMGDIRTEFKTTQAIAQSPILAEFNDEQMLPYVDQQGSFTLDHSAYNVTGLTLYMPVYQTIFSEYIQGHHYGDSYASSATLSVYQIWDIAGWVLERTFHFGQRLGVAWFGFDDIIYLVSQAADSGLGTLHSQIYDTYQEPLLAFMKRLARSLTTLDVRKYHRGRRLHPIPGSVDDMIVKNGYVTVAGAVVPGGISGTVVKQADVQASAWESDELNSIGIILTNHHRDARTFHVTLPRYLYPELGSPRYLVENVEGTRSLVESNVSRPDFDVTVPAATASAGGIRLFELLETWP